MYSMMHKLYSEGELLIFNFSQLAAVLVKGKDYPDPDLEHLGQSGHDILKLKGLWLVRKRYTVATYGENKECMPFHERMTHAWV